MDSRAIGVFDSGLGGLTVLKSLVEKWPGENFIYLGDTARLPYGSKSTSTIRAYSEQNLNFLCSQNVKALVVACNSASTQIFESEYLEIPVFTVIKPGAAKAIQKSQNQRIGVLGTRATIESDAYAQEILRTAPTAQIFSVACPLFVPLAEEGWNEDPVTNLITYRYLQGLVQAEVDTLILGCTHYPLLAPAIQKVMGQGVQLVDSGNAVAEVLGSLISKHESEKGEIQIFVTDNSAHFERMARRIMPLALETQFELVQL